MSIIMETEEVKIIKNYSINAGSGYYCVVFESTQASMNVMPGQFAHVLIKNNGDKLFRRPFSIHDTNPGNSLSIIYKVVGAGTKKLSELRAGESCNLIAPLGRGYTKPHENSYPVIISGGYGSAATYILAKETKTKGVALLGAKSKNDIILVEKYEDLGFEVKLATIDGSIGYKGLVTDLLPPYIENKESVIYGCGPNPMMYKIISMLTPLTKTAELSFDHHMCCGVGSCFGCVIKVKSDNDVGWTYARTCEAGPVFKAEEIW